MSAATDTLQALLGSDWQPATEIQAQMEAAGYSVDQVRTARRRLNVSQGAGNVCFIDGRWRWRLPSSCATCGRPFSAGGHWRGDYWADRPTAPVSHHEGAVTYHDDEPPAPTTSPTAPPPLPPLGPPRCSICGKASAVPPGSPCPYWQPNGRRCAGVVE